MAGRRTLHSRALVIDHRARLSEKDEILTLLLASGEQVSAIAKGALRPGGRLAARVELFSETDFLLARGRSLDIVTEAQLIDAHRGLRGDLERVSCASAICEIARLTSFAGSEDPFLYAICSRALAAAEQAQEPPQLDVVAAAYVLKVLAHGGWRPELDGCVLCGDSAVSFFSPSAGGVLCASCAKDVAGAEPVDALQLSWLKALLFSRFDELVAVSIDAAMSAWLLGLAHRWAATHLDCRLKAMEFMCGLWPSGV